MSKSTSVSSMSLETYLEVHSALTGNRQGSSTVGTINAMEAAWFKTKDLQTVLQLHGFAAPTKAKKEILDAMQGLQLYLPFPAFTHPPAASGGAPASTGAQQPLEDLPGSQDRQIPQISSQGTSVAQPATQGKGAGPPPRKQARITTFFTTAPSSTTGHTATRLEGLSAIELQDLVTLGWMQAEPNNAALFEQPPIVLKRTLPVLGPPSHTAALNTTQVAIAPAGDANTADIARTTQAAPTAGQPARATAGNLPPGFTQSLTQPAAHPAGESQLQHPWPAGQLQQAAHGNCFITAQHQQLATGMPATGVPNMGPSTLGLHPQLHEVVSLLLSRVAPHTMQPADSAPTNPPSQLVLPGPGTQQGMATGAGSQIVPQGLVQGSRGSQGAPAALGTQAGAEEVTVGGGERMAWLAAELLRFCQAAGVTTSNDPIATPSQLINRRVGFLLLKPIMHKGAGSAGQVPVGLHQGAVCKHLGPACVPEVCEPDCKGGHENYTVRLLWDPPPTATTSSTANHTKRVDITLDLHPGHRLRTLDDLLPLAHQEDKLQDAWVLLRARSAWDSDSEEEGQLHGRGAGRGGAGAAAGGSRRGRGRGVGVKRER